MSTINQLASSLYSVLTESDNRKPKPYDTKAEVLRTEGDTVWVKIPGGIDETPVQRTNNANPGDTVMVRVSGGRAWLLGNNTSPPTDDTMAIVANDNAQNAGAIAEVAIKNALDAQDSAARAYAAADAAEAEAGRASVAATEARSSANSAALSANVALDQLGIIENVVGVLKLISEHGQYRETQDLEVVPDKWYFIRSGVSPDYVYSVVQNPSGNPAEQGWYELIGVNDSIRNYVANQLVVDSEGLWLKTIGMQTKVQLSTTDGVVLYGPDGTIVGKYGQTAQVGDSARFHIKLGVWYKLTEDTAIDPDKTYYTRSGTVSNYIYTEVENPVVADIGSYYEQMPQELGFYDGANKVAYISNQQLYITQSVVLQQMDLGTMIANGGFGQWSWKIHQNTNGKNNLNLKWVG